jgi:5S rRNA maturation endonuclease (ribonuclease M5)
VVNVQRSQIREQVSIRQALELLDLDQPNGSGKMSCPFHDEHTPSMHVYQDHVFCFGCGFNGDVVWFVSQLTGQPLWRAEEFLAGNIDLDSHVAARTQVAREPQDMTDLFNSQPETGPFLRELAKELIADRWPTVNLEFLERVFKVRVCRGGLWIPHFDGDRVTGIKVRKFNGGKESVKGSTFRHPYRAPGWPSADRVVVCEGEPDTWTMHQWMTGGGFAVVGLPSGAGQYSAQMHAVLREHSVVWLALDTDQAGRAATQRIKYALADEPVLVHDLLPEMAKYGNDVSDALAAGWQPGFTV